MAVAITAPVRESYIVASILLALVLMTLQKTRQNAIMRVRGECVTQSDNPPSTISLCLCCVHAPLYISAYMEKLARNLC